jgi:hypothetical protein
MANDLYIQPEAFEFEFESSLDEFEPEFGTGEFAFDLSELEASGEFERETSFGEFETGQREYETDFGEFVTFSSETPTTLQLEGGNPVDVRWVQNSLNRILGLRLSVEGIAGPATRSAIRTFQQKQGLTVDGVVGPKAQAAMIAAGAPPPTKRTVTGCTNHIRSAASDDCRLSGAHRRAGHSAGQLCFQQIRSRSRTAYLAVGCDRPYRDLKPANSAARQVDPDCRSYRVLKRLMAAGAAGRCAGVTWVERRCWW